MDEIRGNEQGVPDDGPRPESQRSLTELIEAAVLGAMANPVISDAYGGAKAGVKAAADKLHSHGAHAKGSSGGDGQEPGLEADTPS